MEFQVEYFPWKVSIFNYLAVCEYISVYPMSKFKLFSNSSDFIEPLNHMIFE